MKGRAAKLVRSVDLVIAVHLVIFLDLILLPGAPSVLQTDEVDWEAWRRSR